MKNVNRQSGMTLLELMISMVIGLIVIASAMAVMQANKKAFNLAGNEIRIQENGRFSTGYLKKFLALAGFKDYFRNNIAGAAPLPVMLNGCLGAVVCSSDGAVSDVLTISYHVPSQEVVLNNSFLTCNGTRVNAANLNVITTIADSFSMNPLTNQLQCQSFDISNGANVALGAPLVLAGGIRAFQVLYGVYTDNDINANPRTQLTYVNSGQLAGLGLDAAELAARVQTIKYAMLVSSDTDTGDVSRVTDSYFVLDAAQIDINDGPMARIYTSTALLKNGGV